MITQGKVALPCNIWGAFEAGLIQGTWYCQSQRPLDQLRPKIEKNTTRPSIFGAVAGHSRAQFLPVLLEITGI